MSVASLHRGSSHEPPYSYLMLDAFDLMVKLLGDDVDEAELQVTTASRGW